MAWANTLFSVEWILKSMYSKRSLTGLQPHFAEINTKQYQKEEMASGFPPIFQF